MWKALSGLEQVLMDYIWVHPGCTADDCREGLEALSHSLKDSTVRTLLHRLERKGYVLHDVVGRTYLYRAASARHGIAAQAVKQIVDRFCNGSLEQLLVGMVENDFVSRKELRQMARQVALQKGERNNARSDS
jgi:BlaI family transcriptional regulator, penicillinase repressor